MSGMNITMGPEEALIALNTHKHGPDGIGAQIETDGIVDNAISTTKVQNKAITVEKLGDDALKAISGSPLNPLQAYTINYNDCGQIQDIVMAEGKTYTMTHDITRRLDTISDGIKTIKCQYNTWGQFIGTVSV